MECMWCERTDVTETTKDCYWILPDGKAYVQILAIPGLSCSACGTYLTDEMNHEIDMALYARELPRKQEITFQQLMESPYKNIFELKKE